MPNDASLGHGEKEDREGRRRHRRKEEEAGVETEVVDDTPGDDEVGDNIEDSGPDAIQHLHNHEKRGVGSQSVEQPPDGKHSERYE